VSIEDAVLNEGSLLYPYRPSALKNQHRYPFGTLYPESFCTAQEAGDATTMRLECIVAGAAEARVSVLLRFLQFTGAAATPRTVRTPARTLDELACDDIVTSFAFTPLSGRMTARAAAARLGYWKLTVHVDNDSAFEGAATRPREEALGSALASPHLVLTADGGAFASLIDPPDAVRDLCAGCSSSGTWPVLLGKPGASDTLLSAPIILYDHPQIAPESPGDFFDGTEIDELLTLRVLTLTDDEKAEIRGAGGAGADLLARTEAAGLEQLRGLHGATRSPALHPGMAVRVQPRGRADVMDLALAGKRGTVQAVEHDYEGRVYVAVTLDDDPGKDLGAYGHRFFFRPEELETL
jgi:hypothetical protein